MRRVESCWHCCPICHREHSHDVPEGGMHLDDYFLPCASCRAAGRTVPTRNKPRPVHPGEGEAVAALNPTIERAIDLHDPMLLETLR